MCRARRDELLEEHVGDCRRPCRLRAGPARGRRRARSAVLDDAHAAAAAAHRRLDDDRVAELLGELLRLGCVVDRLRRCRPGPARRPAGRCSRAAILSPSCSSISTRGPTKMMPASRQARAKLRVLREEAVAGMDGVDLVLLGERDDAGDVEVRPDRLARLADLVGLVGLEAVQGEAVFVRVDGDGADAQLVGRAEDADGDLAAVGDEQLLDGFHAARGLNSGTESAIVALRKQGRKAAVVRSKSAEMHQNRRQQ